MRLSNRSLAATWAGLFGLVAGCSRTTTQAPTPVQPVACPSSQPAATEIVEERWPDDTLKLRQEVIRDADGRRVAHGTYTRWYDNGQKEYEAVFVRGQKHGTVTRWHRNGRKWIAEHYVDGKKHGVCTTWDAAGRKRKEEEYLNGQPDGTWTTWDEEGRVRHQQHFEHGEPQS